MGSILFENSHGLVAPLHSRHYNPGFLGFQIA